jgi:hypothetical protein
VDSAGDDGPGIKGEMISGAKRFSPVAPDLLNVKSGHNVKVFAGVILFASGMGSEQL